MSNYKSNYFQVSSLEKSNIYAANTLNLNNSANLNATSLIAENGTDEQVEIAVKKSDDTSEISLKNSGTDEFIPTLYGKITDPSSQTVKIYSECVTDSGDALFTLNFKDENGTAVNGDLMKVKVNATEYTVTASGGSNEIVLTTPNYSLPNSAFAVNFYFDANTPNNASVWANVGNSVASLCKIFIFPFTARLIALSAGIASVGNWTDPTGTIMFKIWRSVGGAAATEFYSTAEIAPADATFLADDYNTTAGTASASWAGTNLMASNLIFNAGDVIQLNMITNATWQTSSAIADTHVTLFCQAQY